MRYLFAGIPTRPFAILYIMHSFASFLRSDRDIYLNVSSILVTLEVLWWRCKTYRAARRWWWFVKVVARRRDANLKQEFHSGSNTERTYCRNVSINAN